MNTRLQGYGFTLLAVTIFATQDGLSKYLATHYSSLFITMIRFWAFAGFVLIVASRSSGGVRSVATTKYPKIQVLRGVLLVCEIVIFVYALPRVGMAMTQAIFQSTPLLITALSVPILGEAVGWKRWAAVIVGMLGVILIINPAGAQFNLYLLLPLTSAAMFAVYSIATRAVSKQDSAVTSLFYTGIAGAAAISLVGPFHWAAVSPGDVPILLGLCFCGASSHYFLIRAYDVLEASAVQPLTYLQLVVGAFIAVFFFDETLSWNMLAGCGMVVSAGLFTMWRENWRRRGTLEENRRMEDGPGIA